MKNKTFKQAMDKLTPNKGTKERMWNEMMTNKEKKKSKTLGLGKTIGAAAVLGLVLLLAVNLGSSSDNKVLFEDNGLKISSIDKAPKVEGNPASSTAIYTEDEVFTLFPIHGFRAQVLELQNIVLEDDFGKTYSSYVTLKIIRSYQGDNKEGDQVKILLPGPIEEDKIMGADFNITRAFKVGEEGIFLPVVNAEIASPLKGFAKYSLYDTMQFAFVKTEDGVDFNQVTFPNLVPNSSLDEIEEFVLNRLNP